MKNFLVLACFLFALAPKPSLAEDLQIAFGTPEAAVEALVSVAKQEDGPISLAIIGEEGVNIISSGDPVADSKERERFVRAYEEKHKIIFEDEGRKAVLLTGRDEWPFPIPMVREEDGWKFDSLAGKQEIMYRRIGRNELNTIQSVLAYVDAQKEYVRLSMKENKQPFYAQQFISNEGKKDGLYWPVASNENPSPLGELFAKASSEGYFKKEERAPYHGYYYKILTRQGPDASGGALDYVVDGKMIGGFALIAWPASYGNSGIMTFIVNHQGIIYERDFGPDTEEIVAGTSSFNPDSEWTPVGNTGAM